MAHNFPVRHWCSLVSSASVALFLSPSLVSAITLDFITVGDPGNPNDKDYGLGAFGAVNEVYAIGKYEVTLLQYAAFLNAVAGTDTYGLYNSSMATSARIAGIARDGTSGSYSYSVLGDGNRPVTIVTWFDAARFINWLHNGQPTGSQTAATTERGAYTLDGALSGVGFVRSPLALYWLPSESEWYKAAFYQPAGAGGDSDGYWIYPTATNSVPNSQNGSGTDPNSGNFYRQVNPQGDGVNDGYAVTGSTTVTTTENYLTPAGAFTEADSYYGTYDQAGNVFEWVDAVSGTSQTMRGGSWFSNEGGVRASHHFQTSPASSFDTVGFRVVAVPEPSSIALLGGSGVALLLRRWRRVGGARRGTA